MLYRPCTGTCLRARHSIALPAREKDVRKPKPCYTCHMHAHRRDTHPFTSEASPVRRLRQRPPPSFSSSTPRRKLRPRRRRGTGSATTAPPTASACSLGPSRSLCPKERQPGSPALALGLLPPSSEGQADSCKTAPGGQGASVEWGFGCNGDRGLVWFCYVYAFLKAARLGREVARTPARFKLLHTGTRAD